MFNDIPPRVLARMEHLETVDARDRTDGTPQTARLRQIPSETGRFIALLAASAPDGVFLEIGTSAGYSTLWLALACREARRSITTFELREEKAKLAAETFRLANVSDVVRLVNGDAMEFIQSIRDIAFCFLDAEKEDYRAFYDAVVPRLVPGGLLVADNAINHRDVLKPLIYHALRDELVDAMVVPIGKGELVCRRRAGAATP